MVLALLVALCIDLLELVLPLLELVLAVIHLLVVIWLWFVRYGWTWLDL